MRTPEMLFGGLLVLLVFFLGMVLVFDSDILGLGFGSTDLYSNTGVGEEPLGSTVGPISDPA